MTKQLENKTDRDAVILPSPEAFFNDVVALEDWLEVNQKANELLELLASKYATSTVIRKLSDYRKKFIGYQHPVDKLNEVVKTDKGDVKQHRVVNVLTLDDSQSEELAVIKQAKKDAADGFKSDGSINEKTLTPIDVNEIIDIACKLIKSNNPEDIVIGLSLVTGRRCFELSVKNAVYEDGIVERDFQLVDDFRIGFKGVAKKSIEEMNQYRVIQSLIPSEIVFNAYQRLINFSDIKNINNSNDREFTNSAFRRSLSRKFKPLFGDKFETIESNEGSLHKCRAFYACAIKAILKAKNIKDSVIHTLIQKSTAHKNDTEVLTYLKKYESSQFINLIDIPLTTNIKELGVIDMPVKKAVPTVDKPEVKEPTAKMLDKTPVNSDKETLTMDLFISQLPGNVQVKIGELTSQGESLESILTMALISLCESKQPRESVTSIIDKLFHVIKIYNDKQTVNTKKVYPTYGLLNKIYKKLTGKQLTNDATYKPYFESVESDVDEYLSTGENSIPIKELKTWNNKHHRKDTDSIIEVIIALYQGL
jgi:uncharacterized protein YehS (DUF1456 family)